MSVTYNITGGLVFDKRLIQEGHGKYRPSDFSHCTIILHASGNNQPESLGDIVGYALDQDILVVIGHGRTHMACVVDICLQTMKEGEKCAISSSVYCEQTKCYQPLELELTLVSFQQHDVEFEALSVCDKTSRASILKELGTAAFRSGDTPVAFYKFSRALKYLACANIDDDQPASAANGVDDRRTKSSTAESIVQRSFSERDRSELTCHCLLNVAACQLRFDNYEMAKTNCTSALAIDPTNVKGLYRRARCYLQLGEPHQAVGDLERAANAEPGNREVVKLLKIAKESIRKNDETLAKAMGKMFQSS